MNKTGIISIKKACLILLFSAIIRNGYSQPTIAFNSCGEKALKAVLQDTTKYGDSFLFVNIKDKNQPTVIPIHNLSFYHYIRDTYKISFKEYNKVIFSTIISKAPLPYQVTPDWTIEADSNTSQIFNQGGLMAIVNSFSKEETINESKEGFWFAAYILFNHGYIISNGTPSLRVRKYDCD